MRETVIFSFTLLIAALLLLQGATVALRYLRRRRVRQRRRALHQRYLMQLRSAAVRLTFAVRATDDTGVTLRTADYLALVRALSALAHVERSLLSHTYKHAVTNIPPLHLARF